MKSSRKLLSYILVLLSAVALSSCHSHKNVPRNDYKPGKTTSPEVEYGAGSSSDGWDYYSSLIINEAKTWLGTPYKYGGSAKKKGTDCSGMTQQVYLSVTGIEIPRNSARQSEYCKKVSNKKVLPGDLVFFNTSGKGVSHVGIYLGNSNMIHASGSKGVMISSLNEQYWQNTFMCCGRVPQLEILAQNYTPKNNKNNKKDKSNKKDKNKKKKEKNQFEDPIYTPGFAEPITSGVIESEYANNSSSSGSTEDDNASPNHYASNWSETVENSSYNTDYVAKARFKTQPSLPVNNTTVNTPSTTEVASTGTTTSPTPPQSSSASSGKLTPPTQHTDVFTNYDQYGGTSISSQPSKTVESKKEQEERLYEEAVSTRKDNKVEITSVNSTANTPSDSQKKTAISPAEAFGKGKTTPSTSTNATPSVPPTKVTTTPTTTVVEEEEEEENPWMD